MLLSFFLKNIFNSHLKGSKNVKWLKFNKWMPSETHSIILIVIWWFEKTNSTHKKNTILVKKFTVKQWIWNFSHLYRTHICYEARILLKGPRIRIWPGYTSNTLRYVSDSYFRVSLFVLNFLKLGYRGTRLGF